jgi:acetyltransferase-like isoleucine patch superfamily enzyme
MSAIVEPGRAFFGIPSQTRIVKAVHGAKRVVPDPDFMVGMAVHLAQSQSRERLTQLYSQFQSGDDEFNTMMRRVLFRAVARRCGDALTVAPNVGYKHLETFEIGSAVFIGAGSYLQGRFDGTCIIGDHVWIGPQSYFDARDLVIEDYVGWGPGAKVLGSAHTGLPVDVPIIQSDLEIRPVRIGAWADIGTGAVILPGVTVGKGAIVGAGAVVNKDVQDFAVVAGVPAHFLHWREGYEPK